MTGLRTIQPTAQPHLRKILENPQEEVLSIPFPSFQKFQVPPPHVSQPTPALELLPDAKKKTPAKPSEIDIVSLPLVTHLNFSPEKKI